MQKKQTKDGAKNPVLSIEHSDENYNNNVYKDSVFMSTCIDKFCEMEIRFMLNHLNKENVFGKKVFRQDLMNMEVKFMLHFISKTKIAEFGAMVKNIIQMKLLNQI